MGPMKNGWCFVNKSPNLLSPLTEDELDELDQFLMSDITSDETMWLDTLNGYLTAIAIGPTTLTFDRWFSRIWGPAEEDMPAFESQNEAQRIINLIIRHFNGIIAVLEHDPDAIEPLFEAIDTDDGEEYLDGEMWADGFMQGVDLCRQDWQPLFEDDEGATILSPILLLNFEDDTPLDELDIAKTLQHRSELTQCIPGCIAWIYRYWKPYRQEVQRGGGLH